MRLQLAALIRWTAEERDRFRTERIILIGRGGALKDGMQVGQSHKFPWQVECPA